MTDDDKKAVQERQLIYLYVHARAVKEHFVAMQDMKFHDKRFYKDLLDLSRKADYIAGKINKDFTKDDKLKETFEGVQELVYVSMDAVIENINSLKI